MKKGKKLKPAKAKEMAKALAGMGQNGDTILAHINPREAMLLHQVTDGGRINPNTGLPAFDEWSDYNESASAAGSYGGNADENWGAFSDNGAPDDGMESPGMGPGNYQRGPTDDGGRSLSGDLGGGPWAANNRDMSFGAGLGRGMANSLLGFVGLHNPGPSIHGQGIKSSPGYGFNLGALAGTYLGAATGFPGLGELGARGFNAFNAPSTSIAANPGAATGGRGTTIGFDIADNGADPRLARALLG